MKNLLVPDSLASLILDIKKGGMSVLQVAQRAQEIVEGMSPPFSLRESMLVFSLLGEILDPVPVTPLDPDRFQLEHDETVSRWDTIMGFVLDKFLDPVYNERETAEILHDLVHEIISLQDKKAEEAEIKGLLLEIAALTLEALSKRWVAEEVEADFAIAKQVDINRELMITKNQTYGSSWSIMRPEGLVDVIHTKVHRILSLLEGVDNKYESVIDSFEDILNYILFTHMRIDLDSETIPAPLPGS